MNPLKTFSLSFAVLFLFLLVYPSFASAHAYIIKSTPYENEIVNEVPKNVSIEFDEPIQSSFHSLEVFDSSGNRVDKKNGRVNPKNPSIIEGSLNENLPDGTYSIKWRVVSSDGHPVEGVIPFQIGNESKDDSGTQESTGYIPKVDLIIIRWLQYVSNASLVGVLFFLQFVLNKELVKDSRVVHTSNKIIKLSFLTLCLSILLSLPLQAAIESGLSWGKVLNIQVLNDVLEYTLFGPIWLIQISCLFILLLSTYLVLKTKFKAVWVWSSFILAIGLLLAKAFTSHAAASTNVWVTIPLDFIHLLTASMWMGSLIVLVSLIPLSKKIDTKNHYLDSIRRFAKWGIILVILLTLTGLIGSLSYVPNIRTLLTTDYGRVLLGKVLLLVVMIGFAAVNFVKGKRDKEKGWASSLWGELITGLAVLILSVLLTNLPTAMSSPGPYKEINTVQGRQVTFIATPNVLGENTYFLSLKNKKGQPITNIEQVTLTFTSLEMDMGEDTKTLVKVKEGQYKAKGMNFNMAGRWNVHVHVLTKDLEALDTDFKILVGS